LEPYAGFGADAHSFDGRERRQNAESPQDYIAGRRGESILAGDDERLFIGLRLMRGVRPDEAEWRRFDAPIRRFVDAGPLASEDGLLRLTARGVMLSNEVFQEFLTQ